MKITKEKNIYSNVLKQGENEKDLLHFVRFLSTIITYGVCYLCAQKEEENKKFGLMRLFPKQ